VRPLADSGHAAVAFELWRLMEENDMLRARTKQQEEDMQPHIESTDASLGQFNKQKIQYHVR